MDKPTLKAIHICNLLQPPHKPKIAKEYVFANAIKFAKKKYENTTTYIKNSGFSAYTEMNFINLRSVQIRKVSV